MTKLLIIGAVLTLLSTVAECTPHMDTYYPQRDGFKPFDMSEEYSLAPSFPDNPKSLHYSPEEKKIIMDWEMLKDRKYKEA